MIIKSISRKAGSVNGLMKYMFEKEAENQLQYQTRDEQLQDFSIRHYLKGHHVNDWIKEFEVNQQTRKFKRKDMVLFYHEVISFSNKDKSLISDVMLQDIARRYIRIRSPFAPAVANIHHDKDHLHIHFCIGSSNYKTGKANRLSKREFASIKLEMEAYQQMKYPELSNSVVEHGKGLDASLELEFRNGERKLSKRAIVKAEVQAIFEQAKDYNDLMSTLETAGMPTYKRGEKIYGVSVEGKNYRFKTLDLANQFEEFSLQQDQMNNLLAFQSDHPKAELLPELLIEEPNTIDLTPTIDDQTDMPNALIGESQEANHVEHVIGELESFSPSGEAVNPMESLPIIEAEVSEPSLDVGGSGGSSFGDALAGGMLFFLPEPPGSIDEGGLAEKKYENREITSPMPEVENIHSENKMEVNEETDLLAELDAIGDQQSQELQHENEPELILDVEYEESDFFVDDYTYVDFEEVDEENEDGEEDGDEEGADGEDEG